MMELALLAARRIWTSPGGCEAARICREVLAVHRLAERFVAKSARRQSAVSVAGSSSGINSAQGPGAGPRDLGEPGCDLFPAPASIGTNVPLSYFGPSAFHR